MIPTILIIFSALNIFLAWTDARKIKEGKVIKHGINGLVYLILMAAAFFLTHNCWLLSAIAFNRLLIFNISLNLFRHLPIFYVSISLKSIIDKLAFKVFGKNGATMYAFYLAAFIILIFFL